MEKCIQKVLEKQRANGNALHLRALSITKRIHHEICYWMCLQTIGKRFFVVFRYASDRLLELFRLNTDDSRN